MPPPSIIGIPSARVSLLYYYRIKMATSYCHARAMFALVFLLAGMKASSGYIVPSDFTLASSLVSSRSNHYRICGPKISSSFNLLRRQKKPCINTCMSSAAQEVTTSNETNAINAYVLMKLDDEMKNAAERRKKLEEELLKTKTKLDKEDARIQDIVTKKNMYLDGAKLGVIPVERTFKESTLRSAVKAMMWRVIAGSITFATAFKFSKSMQTALTIVGSDFFSKSFTMFLGERLMNKSKIGRKGGADNVGRSLAKALLWRVFAVTNTLVAAIFISKDVSIAYKIAGSDAIIKTTLMFVYERVWAKVEWGKEYEIDFSI